MRTLLETKEWAIHRAHLSSARRNGLLIGPISADRPEIGLLLGPFFDSPLGFANATPDTSPADGQGKATTKPPRNLHPGQERRRDKERVGGACDASGCKREADIVYSASMSPWNPPVLVSCAMEGIRRQPTPKHPPAQIGALSSHRVRAPRRFAASHVFASLKRLGQGCAPTPRGGLRCALAARRVQAWEGRA